MFQRRALELLVLSFVAISSYYMFDFMSSDSIPKEYRVSGILPYFYFGMAVVVYYMSLHQTVMRCYDRNKSNKKEKELEMRKQHILINQLEHEKYNGGAMTDPRLQAIQEFIVNETLSPRTKRKNMINLHDPALQQLSTPKTKTPLQKRKVPPPPPPSITQTDSKTIMEKLTPKIMRKASKPNDRVLNEYSNNNNKKSFITNTSYPISVHTPQAKRKLLGKTTTNKESNKIVRDDCPPVSIKNIIAELQTPKSQKHFMQGHTNPSMTPDYIV